MAEAAVSFRCGWPETTVNIPSYICLSLKTSLLLLLWPQVAITG